jgi:hypothetical protein
MSTSIHPSILRCLHTYLHTHIHTNIYNYIIHTYVHAICTYIHTYMTYSMDLNSIIFIRHTSKILILEEFCRTPSLYEPSFTSPWRSMKGRCWCCTARLEIRDAENADIKTSDVTYDIKITIRPDVLLTSSLWPVANRRLADWFC